MEEKKAGDDGLLAAPLDTPEQREEFGRRLGAAASEAIKMAVDLEKARSETPRTDAVAILADGGGAYVDAEFSRQLERELSAARKALDARIQPINFQFDDFFVMSFEDEAPMEAIDKAIYALSNALKVKKSRIIVMQRGTRLELLRKES